VAECSDSNVTDSTGSEVVTCVGDRKSRDDDVTVVSALHGRSYGHGGEYV